MDFSTPFDHIDIWIREYLKVIMKSQWQYKHDCKAKGRVAHISTSSSVPSISPWNDKQHGSNQRKCKMPQLIKTKINFSKFVYQTVLLPFACGQITRYIRMSKLKSSNIKRLVLLLNILFSRMAGTIPNGHFIKK